MNLEVGVRLLLAHDDAIGSREHALTDIGIVHAQSVNRQLEEFFGRDSAEPVQCPRRLVPQSSNCAGERPHDPTGAKLITRACFPLSPTPLEALKVADYF